MKLQGIFLYGSGVSDGSGRVVILLLVVVMKVVVVKVIVVVVVGWWGDDTGRDPLPLLLASPQSVSR